jgi:hypothetical protein
MPKLQWDRTFESSLNRHTGIALVLGTPGFHRTDKGLRPFALPPLEPADLTAMLEELRPSSDAMDRVPGCRSFAVTYGSDFRYRIDDVGTAQTRAIFVTRLLPDVPGPRSDGGSGWYTGWSPDGSLPSWVQLFRACGTPPYSSVVLTHDAPPFFWTESGFHPAPSPPVSRGRLQDMADEILTFQHVNLEAHEFVSRRLRFAYTGELFQVAAFGEPAAPHLLIGVRLGTHAVID